ncbi:MAG: lipocalin-like domain-containing protein [Paracoccaceae bacterium]
MIGKAIALALFLWPASVFAQGFAGLGTEAEEFTQPRQGYQFAFPQDHGAHPDFRIEWWYLTANLKAADGTQYGAQWTLFRSALAPETKEGWQDPQVWFAHAAITTPDRHFVTERFARGGIGQAGVTASPFNAWIDEWQMSGAFEGNMAVSATGPDFGYAFDMTASGPMIFHGDAGFSAKSADGQASYYYSQPFFDVTGLLQLPDGEIPVSGQAWLDREWSSQPLSGNQTGWDWFSLSFDTGDKLMGFRLRQSDGDTFNSATWISPSGQTTSYKDGAFSANPISLADVKGKNIPVSWHVRLPAKGVDVTVEAQNNDSWMDVSLPYWEGPVGIQGSHTGQGYLEMTGYE